MCVAKQTAGNLLLPVIYLLGALLKTFSDIENYHNTSKIGPLKQLL